MTVDKPLTYYSANPDRLVADYHAPDGTQLFFFGDLDTDGEIKNISTVSYKPSQSDTSLHMMLDENNQLSYIYFDVNGERAPAFIKVSYALQTDSSYLYSLYERNWATGENTLIFESWVRNNNGVLVGLPTYLRSDCEIENVVPSIVYNVAAVGIFAVVALTALPTGGTSVWVGAAAIGLFTSTIILNDVCASENNLSNTLPSNYPSNASSVESIFNNTNFVNQCINNPIAFEAKIDPMGSVTFTMVNGGTPPYSFAVEVPIFQSNYVFNMSLVAGQDILLMVRDNSGCISAKYQKVEEFCPTFTVSGANCTYINLLGYMNSEYNYAGTANGKPYYVNLENTVRIIFGSVGPDDKWKIDVFGLTTLGGTTIGAVYYNDSDSNEVPVNGWEIIPLFTDPTYGCSTGISVVCQ